ncbi:MAG: alcohol dehydrogenase catalytic domain-containing protein [Candidatus Poribacteria bacterium]|nr:alcohol dehydrogenase catalytic domain-containing protein [Candidatus Poribacteria bacterium]
MSRTGRATVMTGKDFEVREYPIPEIEPGTVLLRQELGGICGTDLHNWEFQRIEHDIILGHENVGIIDTLGAGVETDYLGNPVKAGDRVVLSPSGGYGFSPSEEQPYLRGGFAEYILWNPKSMFIIEKIVLIDHHITPFVRLI